MLNFNSTNAHASVKEPAIEISAASTEKHKVQEASKDTIDILCDVSSLSLTDSIRNSHNDDDDDDGYQQSSPGTNIPKKQVLLCDTDHHQGLSYTKHQGYQLKSPPKNPLKISQQKLEENIEKTLESLEHLFTSRQEPKNQHDESLFCCIHRFSEQYDELVNSCGLSPFLRTSFWNYLQSDHGSCKKHQKPSTISFTNFKQKFKFLILNSRGDKQVAIFHILLSQTYPFTHTSRKRLCGKSFEAVCEDVVRYHPDLRFLKNNNEIFKKRYIETVIIRIFYSINHSPVPRFKDLEPIDLRSTSKSNQQLGIGELAFVRSGFCQVLSSLSNHNHDINSWECSYFSYKHFFVIYCKFYDLDLDEKFYLSHEEFGEFDNGAINPELVSRIMQAKGLPAGWQAIDKHTGNYKLQPYHYKSCDGDVEEYALRVMNGCGGGDTCYPLTPQDSGVDLGQEDDEKRSKSQSISNDHSLNDINTSPGSTFCPNKNPTRKPQTLIYADFVWFLLSEEDRSSVTAKKYWFRLMDLDDDGVLSMWELERLYARWDERSQLATIDTRCFNQFLNVLCASLDGLSKPTNPHEQALFTHSGNSKHAPKKDQVSNIQQNQTAPAITMNDLLITGSGNTTQPQHQKSTMTNRFLDTFINWQKLAERESNCGNRLAREVMAASPQAPQKKSLFAHWADNQYQVYLEQESEVD